MVEARFRAPTRQTPSASFNAEGQSGPTFNVEVKGTNHHERLQGLDIPNQHPIQTIIGLDEALTGEESARETADQLLQQQIDEIYTLANGYVHEQGVASAVWTVQHNLNKYPSVTVVDSSENEIIAEVEYLDKNTVRITMRGASKGRAYLN